MTAHDPTAGFQLWTVAARTDAAGAGVTDATAEEARLLADLLTGGIVQPADGYQVTERAAGANMSVDVGSGAAGTDTACVEGTEPGQGNYLVRLGDAVTNVTIDAADLSNPRIDQVFLVVFEDVLDSSGRTMARFFVRKGTPGSSPAAPGPDGSWTAFLLLADVLVGAGATSIEDAAITDQRVPADLVVGGTAEATADATGDTLIRRRSTGTADVGDATAAAHIVNRQTADARFGVSHVARKVSDQTGIGGTETTITDFGFTINPPGIAVLHGHLSVRATLSGGDPIGNTLTIRLKRAGTTFAEGNVNVTGSGSGTLSLPFAGRCGAGSAAITVTAQRSTGSGTWTVNDPPGSSVDVTVLTATTQVL